MYLQILVDVYARNVSHVLAYIWIMWVEYLVLLAYIRIMWVEYSGYSNNVSIRVKLRKGSPSLLNFVHVESFCSNVCFHARPSYFLQSIQGLTCHGCVIHDILVGFCSEFLMRLSCYIHRAYGKQISTLAGLEPWTLRSKVVCLNRSTKALTCHRVY